MIALAITCGVVLPTSRSPRSSALKLSELRVTIVLVVLSPASLKMPSCSA